MNYCWPGVLNVMFRRKYIWITFWYKGERYHYERGVNLWPFSWDS